MQCQNHKSKSMNYDPAWASSSEPHFDKAKAFASTRFSVRDHFGAPHFAVGAQQLLQIGTADFVTEIPNIQFSAVISAKTFCSFVRELSPVETCSGEVKGGIGLRRASVNRPTWGSTAPRKCHHERFLRAG